MILGSDGKPAGTIKRNDLATNYDVQVRALFLWLSDYKLREFLEEEHILSPSELAMIGGLLHHYKVEGRRLLSHEDLKQIMFVMLSSWKCRKIIAAGVYNRYLQRGKHVSIKECLRSLRDLRSDLEAEIKRAAASSLVIPGGN